MNRRNFIKQSALASTAFMVPDFLRGFSARKMQSSRSGKILVVVQLSGGNDGLNTVVPFQNDIYYRSRPTLALPKNEVLSLSDELGLHPQMDGLRALYDEGLVSIINSVGYPNPDRSHFRSMDIWHTASNSDEYLSTGWLGRYLDSNCVACEEAYHVLEMDDSLSLAVKGTERSGFAMGNPKRLKKATSNPFLEALGQQGYDQEEPVAYLYKTMIDTQSSADYLFEQSKKVESKGAYPPSRFGKDLKRIAELIMADTDTKIYYVSLSGFDTHANQKNVQARLLKQYSEGMQAFVKDLKQHGLLDDTLIMTFSEFGRRVSQNASNGTDHGTANNVFLIGGGLKKPGFYNQVPDLKHLDKGDLIYDIDFRRIYSSILDGWLESDSQDVLGERFQKLPVF